MEIPRRGLLCDLRWLKSSECASPADEPVGTLRLVDLFSGCGGMSLGAVEAIRHASIRPEIALAVDANEDALKVYAENFGSICKRSTSESIEEIFQGNLGAPFSVRELKLAEEVGAVDLLEAGPPCQGHSSLNNHSRQFDSRNALYARVVRAAELFKPKAVLIENVTGVVNDRGHVVSRARKHLAGIGYAIESIQIDARDFGVPQRRRRHFLIAIDRSLGVAWKPLRGFSGKHLTVGDVLDGLEDGPESSRTLFETPSTCSSQNQKRIDYLFDSEAFNLPDEQRPACHKDFEHSYKAVYGRIRRDGFANTITSGFGSMGQGRYVHPTRRRLITPHEAARLQGFPDWFTFDGATSRGSLQEMIGNAVIPRVSAFVVHHLLSIGALAPRLVEVSDGCFASRSQSRTATIA